MIDHIPLNPIFFCVVIIRLKKPPIIAISVITTVSHFSFSPKLRLVSYYKYNLPLICRQGSFPPFKNELSEKSGAGEGVLQDNGAGRMQFTVNSRGQ